jgi:hypothetical protein
MGLAGPSKASLVPSPLPATRTWSDGLEAKSRRLVTLHPNAEYTGPDSSKWVDVHCERGYNPVSFTPQDENNSGWTPAGCQSVDVILNKNYAQSLEILGPIFSGGGPGGLIIMELAGLTGGSLEIAFASVELAGALLDLVDTGDETWTVHRDTYNTEQCDNLTVNPPILCDTDGDGTLDGPVEHADFTDYNRLVGLKSALARPNTSIQSFSWNLSSRLCEEFWFERFDQWGSGGYRGSDSRRRGKDMPLPQAHYQMSFVKRTP